MVYYFIIVLNWVKIRMPCKPICLCVPTFHAILIDFRVVLKCKLILILYHVLWK